MGFMAVRALEALDQAVSCSKALLEQVHAKRFLSVLLIYAKLHQAVLASYHDILLHSRRTSTTVRQTTTPSKSTRTSSQP